MKAARLLREARIHFSEPLYRSAYSLMAGTVITAVLGVGFWIVAARAYPSEVVGRDGALIAAMIALSTVAQLNLAWAVIRFLPRMGGRTRAALAAVYVASGAAALVLALAFVLVVPRVVDELSFLRDDPGASVLFVVGMVAWGTFVIQDSALAALRHALWIPIENAVFAVGKLAALPILAGGAASHGILASWVVPVAVIVPVMCWLVFRRAMPRHVAAQTDGTSTLDDFPRRRLLRFLGQDYLGTVISHGAMTLLPLVVVAVLGARENAYFFVAFTLVTTFDMLLTNVVTSLTVEGAVLETRVVQLTRDVVRHLVGPLVVASLALIAAAPLVLLPFGQDYAREGAPLVRILACATVFRAAIVLFVALCRLRGRGRPMVAIELCTSVLLLGLSLLLAPSLGSQGVALAWLIASAVPALAVSRPLIRSVRPARPAPAERGGAAKPASVGAHEG